MKSQGFGFRGKFLLANSEMNVGNISAAGLVCWVNFWISGFCLLKKGARCDGFSSKSHEMQGMLSVAPCRMRAVVKVQVGIPN